MDLNDLTNRGILVYRTGRTTRGSGPSEAQPQAGRDPAQQCTDQQRGQSAGTPKAPAPPAGGSNGVSLPQVTGQVRSETVTRYRYPE